MDPVSHFACASDADESHYMGFTTETPETVFEAESRTSSSPTTTSSPSTAASTNPTPPITEAPNPSNEAAAQTNTQSSSGASTADSGSGNNIGIIVGGAVGGLVLGCGSALAAVWLLHRKRRANAAKSGDSDSGDGTPWTKAELDGAACSSERTGSMAQAWSERSGIMAQSERVEIMGQPRAELSAKGPAAYDTANSSPESYRPMTPVELPTRDSWR
ncbi:hypothetical protein VTJ49DRAFT_4213 [Mycothermus thermophilus]|uniref:Mid2 domain-containing protein n=1 Tax=Humicola insolens TaxID=85995 RepID=A0ABR3V5X4_HUMIN